MSLRVTAGVTACVALLTPAIASAYSSRVATGAETLSIVRDATRTQLCGYPGVPPARLTAFRVVSYSERDYGLAGSPVLRFEWAQTFWTQPALRSILGTQGEFLVFVHVVGYRIPYKVARQHWRYLSWYPFSCGSSPLDNPPSLLERWKTAMGSQLAPPDWYALERDL